MISLCKGLQKKSVQWILRLTGSKEIKMRSTVAIRTCKRKLICIEKRMQSTIKQGSLWRRRLRDEYLLMLRLIDFA
jgi:hypothetical protein